MTLFRTAVRLGLTAGVVAGVASLPGCAVSTGAPEESATTSSALSLPPATCTHIYGHDDKLAQFSVLKTGGGDLSTDPTDPVVQFQKAMFAAGAGGIYTIAANIGGTHVSFYAFDVSNMPQSTVEQTMSENWGQWLGPPVDAGYYSCEYDTGDYQLPPNGKLPYMPAYIVPYDPRGCGSCL